MEKKKKNKKKSEKNKIKNNFIFYVFNVGLYTEN
jgi:hypothetical protein